MRAVRLKRPSGSWSPPIHDEKALEKSVRARLKTIDGPVSITEPGVGTGPKLTKQIGGDRFVQRLMNESIGTHLLLLNDEKKGIHGRVVDVAPTAANTSGSPGVDLWVGFLHAEFPGQWESWGGYVYKQIAGTSTWSDHAYVSPGHWCGRALDVHPHSMLIGDRIKTATLGEPALAKELRYLLWRVPSHYDHVHGSFEDGGYPGRCG